MHRQRKATRRAKRPTFTTVYADGMGGEIRYHFELENLEALLDGQRVGFPRCEVDGIELIAQARADCAGVRLR